MGHSNRRCERLDMSEQVMPFPSRYAHDLRMGKKTMTFRIKGEVGKYVVGEVYRATTYRGRDLGIKVVILRIDHQETLNPGMLVIEGQSQHDRSFTHTGPTDIIQFKTLS